MQKITAILFYFAVVFAWSATTPNPIKTCGGGWYGPVGRTSGRTLLHEENRFPQLLLRPKLTAKRLRRRRRRRANKGKAGKDSCRQFFGLKTAFLEKPIEVTTDNASVSFYAGFAVGMQTSKARTTDGSGIASRGFIRHKEYCHSERE